MRVTAPFCDDIPMHPTIRTPPTAWAPQSWQTRPAAQPLRVVGTWLDAGAVHPRHSARGHLPALAASNGIAPDPTALPSSRLRVRMVAEAGSVRAAMKATITVVVSGCGSRDDASVGTDGGREALRYEHVIAV